MSEIQEQEQTKDPKKEGGENILPKILRKLQRKDRHLPKSEKENEKSKIEIPERITTEWIDAALKRGSIRSHKGKKLFVREHDPSFEETQWLKENYGEIETGRPEAKTYVYHAAPAENINNYLKHGLFTAPISINLSGIRSEQVHNTATHKGGSLGRSAVFVWKTPWKNLEYKGGFHEHYYIPKKKYEGQLPQGLPKHLRDSEDLRVLAPDDIIGVYINKTK